MAQCATALRLACLSLLSFVLCGCSDLSLLCSGVLRELDSVLRSATQGACWFAGSSLTIMRKRCGRLALRLCAWFAGSSSPVMPQRSGPLVLHNSAGHSPLVRTLSVSALVTRLLLLVRSATALRVVGVTLFLLRFSEPHALSLSCCGAVRETGSVLHPATQGACYLSFAQEASWLSRIHMLVHCRHCPTVATDPHCGRRVGEAKHPGPPQPRIRIRGKTRCVQPEAKQWQVAHVVGTSLLVKVVVLMLCAPRIVRTASLCGSRSGVLISKAETST
eukprot:1413742-Amphidinium_carterae.1